MSDRPTPCSAPESRQFDFWLGEWNLSWPADQIGGAEGELGTGTNKITRLFGDCAIEENFSTADGVFQGRSHSVFNPTTGLWQQTWVDNQGSYLAFTGGMDGDVMEIRTEVQDRNGAMVQNRMRFEDITDNSLTWHWQESRDGGDWTELWTITYMRQS